MTKQHYDMNAFAIDLVAACARQTSASGIFDCKSHRRQAGTPRLREHPARSSPQTPLARSIRLVRHTRLGLFMANALSTAKCD